MAKLGQNRAVDLLTVAKRLFDHYGYRKTTLSDLANELGITKSTLYHYYKNKEDLFREVVKYWFEQDRIKLKKMLSDIDTDIIDSLARTLDVMIEGRDLHRGVDKNSWLDLADALIIIRDLINDHYQALLKIIADYLEQAADQGLVKKHNYTDTARAILLINMGARQINDFFHTDEPWSKNTYSAVNFIMSPYLVKAEIQQTER